MRGLYRKFLFDLIVAVCACALGVIMLPVFEIVDIFVDILVAAALSIYLVLFLLDKLRLTRGTVFALTVLEFFLLSIAVVLLIIQQFAPVQFFSVCQVIGAVIWLRGIGITIKLYISALNVRKPRRELGWFATALIMITLGVWLFVSPIFSDVFCEWLISIALFLAALIFAALAFLFYPTKAKKQG